MSLHCVPPLRPSTSLHCAAAAVVVVACVRLRPRLKLMSRAGERVTYICSQRAAYTVRTPHHACRHRASKDNRATTSCAHCSPFNAAQPSLQLHCSPRQVAQPLHCTLHCGAAPAVGLCACAADEPDTVSNYSATLVCWFRRPRCRRLGCLSQVRVRLPVLRMPTHFFFCSFNDCARRKKAFAWALMTPR